MTADRRDFARRGLLALVAAALGLLLLAPSALALELHVNVLEDRTGGECGPAASCSLREALEVVERGAFAGPGGTETTVEGAVVIRDETSGRSGIGANGELLIDPADSIDSVAVIGPGAEQLTIDAEEEARALTVVGGDVTISGLTIENGLVDGPAVGGDGGGAIHQEGGTVALEGVVLTENKVTSGRGGGAIYLEGGSLSIVASKLSHNSTESDLDSGPGGAICEVGAGASLDIHHTELSHDSASGGNGGAIYQGEGDLSLTENSLIALNTASDDGGGISTDAGGADSTTIEETVISGNSAGERGGGLYSSNGSGGVSVADSTISANEAPEYGGGVLGDGPTTIRTSTVTANKVPQVEPGFERLGGGVAVEAGELVLDRTTIAGNENVGLYVEAGSAKVRASTIAANTSPNTEAGGIVNEAGLSLRSTILDANSGESGAADCGGTVTSEGHNLVSDPGSGCSWASAEGDQLNADPQLGPLANNGGATETMAPTTRASLAINHGSNPATTDQRGRTRPVGLADVGAVEVQAAVNETAPSVSPSSGLELGTELTCSRGTWTSDTVTDPTFAFAWLDNGVEVATGATHVLTNADAGKQLECRVTADDGAAPTAAFSNSVELEPGVASLSPASLDFGSRNLGAGPGAAQALTVTNTGVADLTVSGATSGDASEFPLNTSDCTAGVLHSGESCEITARFSPTSLGPLSSTVTVQSDGGAPTAQLTGTGTTPAFSIFPSSFDFGQVRNGTSLGQTFEVTNSGTGLGTLGAATVEGAAFAIPANGDACKTLTLQPGEECEIEVVFAPTATGTRNGTLRVPSTAPTATAALSGTGTAAAITAAPTSIDFGSRQIGNGSPTTVPITISNPGTASNLLGQLEITGGQGAFEIAPGSDRCSGETLEPAQSCTVEVSFEPPAVGTFTGVLHTPGQAAVSVPLRGVGNPVPVPPTPPPEPAPPVPKPSAGVVGAPGTPHEADTAGAVSLEISCDSQAGDPCQVALGLLPDPGGKSSASLGSWSGQVGAGATKAVTVPLIAAARKALGKSGQLRADVALATAGGEETTELVVLSPPPAPGLAVRGARRHGKALLVALACTSAWPRCEGRVSLALPGKKGAVLAAGKVSLRRGSHSLRLPLSAAGKRTLEADPRPSLVAKATVSDRVYQRTVTNAARFDLGG